MMFTAPYHRSHSFGGTLGSSWFAPDGFLFPFVWSDDLQSGINSLLAHLESAPAGQRIVLDGETHFHPLNGDWGAEQ